MISITIDDKKIEVNEGTTVLEASRQAGIIIPTLCDHPELTPYGGCRLCLVEVEGARTLQPSCTLPASNHMVVLTDTERTREARKFVLTLIFSERNHFCMFCQVSGGDCELQNAAYHEGMTHWPLSPNYQTFPVDASNPYFVLDHNRCILCRRCVRACNELVGNFTLGFEERGAKSFLVADLGAPLGQSSCVSCGTCVQVCPTGALIDRDSAYRGRETQVDHTLTTCIGCSLGCGLDVLTRDNNLVRIDGDWDSPVSSGVICKTGRFIPVNEDRQRILTPMIRKDGALKAATWDEALTTIVNKIRPLAGKNGNGLAAIASTRLPVEALSQFKQLFANQLQSGIVTSLEEGAFTAATQSVANENGMPFEGKLDAINASDCVIAIGVDLVNDHEVAGFFIKRSLPQGTHLVVIDSQDNPLEALAKIALKPEKGTEIDLLLGLASAVVNSGTEAQDLDSYAPKNTGQKTGLEPETIVEAAKLIAESKCPVIVLGSAVTKNGSQATVKAALTLATAAGGPDQCKSTVVSIKGEANSLAAALLQLEHPIEIKSQQAAYVALGDDTPSQKLIQALENVPFVAVQASYVSPLTAKADVVLPVEIWSEQEGHYINLEGRIQAANRSIKPAEGIRANAAVFAGLAEQLGFDLNDDWKAQLGQVISSVNLFD